MKLVSPAKLCELSKVQILMTWFVYSAKVLTACSIVSQLNLGSYGLLEDRRIESRELIFFSWYKTRRLHVSVGPFSCRRGEKWWEHGDTLEYRLVCDTHQFLRHLWSIIEQTHGSMESFCLSDLRHVLLSCAVLLQVGILQRGTDIGERVAYTFKKGICSFVLGYKNGWLVQIGIFSIELWVCSDCD